VRAGVVSSRDRSAQTHWQQWTTFCISLGLDDLLSEVDDKVPLLQIFGARYRDGRLAPRQKSVRSRTVEDALRSVGQTFARLGAHDPRKDHTGDTDFRLARQLRSYTKADPPAHRVKPLPIQIVHHVLAAALGVVVLAAAGTIAVADMIVIAFFFLLRPGEYTGTATDDTPFRLADIILFLGARRIHGPALLTAPDTGLAAATGVSLTFTTQKNGVKGEVVFHGRSGHLLACPVRAIVRRILHHRAHRSPLDTPLASYYERGRLRHVAAADITSALRLSVQAIGLPLGLLPSDISARSMRAGGAMALLCARVDQNIIQLLGRWRSDEMMRYLHLQAQPIMKDFSRLMLEGGSYSLVPGQNIPLEPVPVH
jgi:hypothetical protein